MTVMGIQWDQLPKVAVRWLDEREVCNLVNRFALGGSWAEFEERCQCDAYWVGACRRAGQRPVGHSARVSCAFEDDRFDWLKAADWQPVAGGGVRYAPEQNEQRVKGRKNGNGR